MAPGIFKTVIVQLVNTLKKYIRLLSSVQNKYGSFYMNRSTFRDFSVGGF